MNYVGILHSGIWDPKKKLKRSLEEGPLDSIFASRYLLTSAFFLGTNDLQVNLNIIWPPRA